MTSVIRAAAMVTLIVGCLTMSAVAQEKLALGVLGQPLAVGEIQDKLERPFFGALAEKTGLPVVVDYRPDGAGGVFEDDPLAALASGRAQIAAMRISQVGRRQPMLLGLDLVGLNADYKSARRIVDTYTPVLDKELQERAGVKIVAPWPFGPEILFCKKPIANLADIKNLKVRVYDVDSADLVKLAQGTPVQVGFAATYSSLSSGAIDCAVGSPAAAVAAGWPEVTTHVLPVAFQLGINAYGIALSAWNKLEAGQQQRLISAFHSLSDEIWLFSEKMANDAIDCSAGSGPCPVPKTFHLKKLPTNRLDVDLAREALRSASFPRWAQTCDAVNPGCSASWKQVVGPLVGIK